MLSSPFFSLSWGSMSPEPMMKPATARSMSSQKLMGSAPDLITAGYLTPAYHRSRREMSEDKEQVQVYQKLVLSYEALDEQIDALLERNGGHTENMSEADRQTYRQLAHERD